MRKRGGSLFFAVVGDVHGRFDRVDLWIRELERARGTPLDFVLAVGDVEAFRTAEDPGRKLTKRPAPMEFEPYGRGERRFPRPLHWIGGNNEGFAELDRLRSGGTLAPNVDYLGRSGWIELRGLQVAFLSGIYAPRFYDRPVEAPTSPALAKQAGYFRASDLAPLQAAAPRPELMLLHEWPRGLVRRRKGGPVLRAHRFPWIGNPIARQCVERLQPQWLFCGHSHVPLATALEWDDGSTFIACLDRAIDPETAFLWMVWSGGEAQEAGWGVTGKPVWRSGETWDERLTPDPMLRMSDP